MSKFKKTKKKKDQEDKEMAWARANVDHPDEDGYTPLMVVANNGQWEVAR